MDISNYKISIWRRIIQIIAFIAINYVIIEAIFSINLKSFEGFVKALPILNSPRNPLSKGAGFVEYIFYSMAEGEFPFFIITVPYRIFTVYNCPRILAFCEPPQLLTRQSVVKILPYGVTGIF